MFVVRQAKPKDVGALVKLARMVYFVNLPPDERLLGEKIAQSARCFIKAGGGEGASGLSPNGSSRRAAEIPGLAQMDQESDLFVFVIEDTETGGVVGTGQIRARQGGPGNPNWSFQLSEKRFFSTTLGYGSTHTVGRLYGDESGPTEIGGLILQPSHRGHGQRPGRLLSFSRFNFIACHRRLFADRVLAEMMAPVTADGDSLFWDHLGRKFIPVKYAEADRFCQHNRRFIPELFPKEEIYLTLFPLEVQNQLATVSKETVPARRMLESIGFRYHGHIDPFDGGPHLDADTDRIPLVRETSMLEVGKPIGAEKCRQRGIVSLLTREGEFRAVEAPMERSARSVRLPEAVVDAVGGAVGGTVGVTPLPRPAGEASGRRKARAGSRRRPAR
ncbi:MAG: arginine N-succinyltransferase [Phycisphaerae bacterium]|nr:arginine N-succinyltransferase [Phycisphaerae bacterium]